MRRQNEQEDGMAFKGELQVSLLHHTAVKRQIKISSLAYSEQRDRSESQSSTKSNWKSAKKGLSLVSSEKASRESSSSKGNKDVKVDRSFMDINDSIIVKIKDKENGSLAHPFKIRQPQFHKCHPLQLSRVNGACLSKLIAQKAFKQKQHPSAIPKQ